MNDPEYQTMTRSEAEALLGYVFAHAGPERVPVYRLADPNGNGGYANADYQLRPRLALNLSAIREDREFADGSRNDQDTLARIGLTYDFSRHLSGSVGWQRRERDSDVPGQDYRENVATKLKTPVC